jgi:phenylacetic acid degradation operon negative regulatory protein
MADVVSLAQPAAPPRLSRRHAAGTDTARGLLFTVLGEFVLPGGGTAWTSAVIDTFARLGVEEKATRQALLRTAEDGWLSAERLGRRTRWRLTPAATKLLVEGTERIYGFRAVAPEWDGRWLVVLARAPESERAARHLLRTRLTWAGLGSPAPGVWISPHAERLAEVARVLDEAGLAGDAQAFTGPHAGVGEVPAMVRAAWDLDELAGRYAQFRADFAGRRPDDALATVVELVHAWRRFPWIDPVLPARLLPKGWPGRAAAALFTRAHARWSAAARAEWQELNS